MQMYRYQQNIWKSNTVNGYRYSRLREIPTLMSQEIAKVCRQVVVTGLPQWKPSKLAKSNDGNNINAS